MAEILALFANISPEAAKRAVDMGKTGENIGKQSMAGYAAMFNIGTVLGSAIEGKSLDKDAMKHTNDNIRNVGGLFGGGIGLAVGLGNEKLKGAPTPAGFPTRGDAGRTPTKTYQGLPQTSSAPSLPPVSRPPASRPTASRPPASISSTPRPPASNPYRSSGSGFGNIPAEKGCSSADLMCISSVN
jgi:hypothetical protein